MKIKVCGLKHPGNVEAVTGLEPDYVGFIFYPPSPRYVEDLDPELLAGIPTAIQKTAVFVNEDAEKINALLKKHEFAAIQLHGSESAGFCQSFRDRVTVIKAFGINGHFDFATLDAYANQVDYFLFDTKSAVHGGSGESFDWNLLNNYKLDIPFFLSGGISLDNLSEINKITHPQLYGVDLNSRFEISPGIKDIERLVKAFDLIKHTAHEVRS